MIFSTARTRLSNAGSRRSRRISRRYAPDVAFVHAVTPHYRSAALEIVLDRLPADTFLLTGTEHFDETRQTDLDIANGVVLVRNVFLFNRRVLIQRDVWRAGFGANVCVFDLNPRILSTWALLAARRLVGRKSIVWGHVWPRAGRGSRTATVRKWFRSFADAVITYTQSEAVWLRNEGSNTAAFAAPNALYRFSEIVAAPASSTDGFIYVGRLVDDKRLPIALTALARLRDDSIPAKLMIVGGGPSRSQLESMVSNLDLDGSVEFAGEVTDPLRLRELYAGSVASICPGAVGLALIQSLGFGVPMIIPAEERHGPEIEAAHEGWNCLHFDAGSAESLACGMRIMLEEAEIWNGRRSAISAESRSAYSAEAMAQGILAAIDAVSSGAQEERHPWRLRAG